MSENSDLPTTRQAHALALDLAQALDPIARVTALIGEDPSLAELIAFRTASVDVKHAASEARRLENEATRIQVSDLDFTPRRKAMAALNFASLGFKAVVMIWPSDNLEIVDAKLALSETTGPYLVEEHDHVVSLDPALARRVRLKRAAFAVGELMLPPGPKAPGGESRGLAQWPESRFDLAMMLPARGGEPLLTAVELQRWVERFEVTPEIAGLAELAERLFATSDRLRHLARVKADADPVAMRQATEGALIAAYLAAAQVAIHPAVKRSPAAKLKAKVAAMVDDRAGRPDPLPMQAAIRTLFDDGARLAGVIDPDRMDRSTPSWIEIV